MSNVEPSSLVPRTSIVPLGWDLHSPIAIA
jgi:hypothetical protein